VNHRRVTKAAVAGAVLLAAAHAARRGLSPQEDQIYRSVNDLPGEIAPVAWLPMQAGALAYPMVLAGVMYWRTRTPQLALSIAAAGVSAWVGAKIVKNMVGRGRPYDFNANTNLRLGTETDGSLGFVSGHAAVSFSVASVVSDQMGPIPGVAAYSAAVVASLSRVYVGAHLPLDIVGGAAFGVVVGEIAEIAVLAIRRT